MIRSIALAAALALLSSAAQAEPTHIMVRAQALDAKFIGDHMGGVRVTLIDARTGKVLAKGLTTGGTGDTARIMKAPRTRNVDITDHETAGFAATLELTQPTLIRAEAEGPVGKPGASIKVSSELWVLPGRNVEGDGWVLTFPGLVIEPATTAPADGGGLKVSAKVSLMCGCPIEPGGLWDAAGYRVEASLLKDGRAVAQAPLTYAGQPSQFAGILPAVGPGKYRLRIVATDTKTPNAGVSDAPVQVRARR